MKIKILSSGNLNLNTELKEYIDKKINDIEDNFFSNQNDIECTFKVGSNSATHKNNKKFFAEASIKTPTKLYGARSDQETILEAIDHLKDELTRKISSHKDKKTTFLKKSGRKAKELLRKILK